MIAFFSDRKPDVVVMSADWLEYARPPRFDGMIADLRQTISRLNELGVAVVLLGPGVNVPLSWDHAHLTAEGSSYVMEKIAPMLGFQK